jgi:hypothetical protein
MVGEDPVERPLRGRCSQWSQLGMISTIPRMDITFISRYPLLISIESILTAGNPMN